MCTSYQDAAPLLVNRMRIPLQGEENLFWGTNACDGGLLFASDRYVTLANPAKPCLCFALMLCVILGDSYHPPAPIHDASWFCRHLIESCADADFFPAGKPSIHSNSNTDT